MVEPMTQTRGASRFDIAGAFSRMARAQAEAGQPGRLLAEFDAICADAVGHVLFTILASEAGERDVTRVYSSRPDAYPTAGRKPMGPTEWGERLLRQGRTWFGRTPEDIRWAFFDHELIASLGGEACLNAPVRWNGGVLGVVSVVGPQGRYTEADLEALDILTQGLAPALLARRITEEPAT